MSRDAIELAWNARKAQRRQLEVVNANLVKQVLGAIANDEPLDDVIRAAGFTLEAKEVQCMGFMGPHTHDVDGIERFAQWLCNELHAMLTHHEEEDEYGR